jgi:ribosome recycling factor
MNIPQILKDTRAHMDKALDSTKHEFATIRSGKATTNMLDTVKVEIYGASMMLNQVATISAPEPRLLIVTPFDRGQIKWSKGDPRGRPRPRAVGPGRADSRPLPSMNEQRRKELAKVVHKLAEEGRIAVRHWRSEGVTVSRSSTVCRRTT